MIRNILYKIVMFPAGKYGQKGKRAFETPRSMVFLVITSTQQLNIAGIMIFLVLSVVLIRRLTLKQAWRLQLQKQHALISSQKELIDSMSRQLEAKRSQSKLNPHFLFNSLNAIQYFVVQGNSSYTLKYIHRFGQFLRKILKTADRETISVADEAELLQHYLWLEENRFAGKFTYRIQISQATERWLVPPLITLGMVEHILYHSILAEKPGLKKFLEINFVEQAGSLVITIEDNGPLLKGAHLPSERLREQFERMNFPRKQSVHSSYVSDAEYNRTTLTIATLSNAVLTTG